jgi:hypothetical protein
MRGLWKIVMAPGCLVFIIGVFVFGLLLVKLLWGWTIPDLFPGAVEKGLVARSISWFTALKVAIFIAVLAGVAGISRGGHKS